MMPRRANGEGSLYKTPDGRWRGFVTVGFVGGRQLRRYRTARTRAEVQTKLTRLRNELQLGNGTEPSRETVRHHIADWIDTHIRAHRSPSTEDLYRSAATKHIYPRLGDDQLRKLNQARVQWFVDDMTNGKVPSRIRQVAFDVLGRGLRHAMKMGKLTADPTAAIQRPGHDAEEIFPFESSEAMQLIAATHGDRWHAMIVLAMTTGMRIGELLGIGWDAIDLREARLRVVRQAIENRGKMILRKPKTKTSVRTVELPAIAVKALESHRAIMLREGWIGSEVVFPARDGGVMRRTNFSRRIWKPLLIRLELKARGFHHARHTYATLALGGGVPVHVVSRVMGHAKPSTTLDIYAHVLKAQQSQATSAMELIFAGSA